VIATKDEERYKSRLEYRDGCPDRHGHPFPQETRKDARNACTDEKLMIMGV
jgi:hypothetical protein